MPRVHVTFLAAHVVPPEYFGRQRDYVEAVGAWCADAAAAGADSVDVYCDEGHFSHRGGPLGARAPAVTSACMPRIHAARRPAGAAPSSSPPRLGCASADLLHHCTDEDIAVLARYGVPAVVCPGTALQHGSLPPVRRMLAQGVPIALGSDHNPGHCGITSMSLVIASPSPPSGSASTTRSARPRSAARTVLGAPDRGVLAPGRLADIVQWDADHEGAFAWAFGLKPRRVWRGGTPVQ